MTTERGRRVHIENTTSRVKTKKVRLELVNRPGFVEVNSAHKRTIVWYFAKNINNDVNYDVFLNSLKANLHDLLLKIVSVMNSIKFNLKLEATYIQPRVEDSAQNRSFKTSATSIFMDSNINILIDRAFVTLMSEEEEYKSKGSGFSLNSIDGLVLTIYKYTPLGYVPGIQLPIINFESDSTDAKDFQTHSNNNNNKNNNKNNNNNNSDSNLGPQNNNTRNFNVNCEKHSEKSSEAAGSYIKLPDCIDNKRATINPQNNDEQCFKWAILAKYVTGPNKHRVFENYTLYENKYDFSGLSFPTPWYEVKIFEKNNIGQKVSVNIYGLEKKLQSSSKPMPYHIFPLKVVDIEKVNHFDILYFTEGVKSHYIYISNLSRLIRSQTTLHGHSVYFCKRCFTSFDDQHLKYRLSGGVALKQHLLICGSHKPIRPIMPVIDTMLEFKAWGNTQRHPFAIYADFESLLIKSDESKGVNTKVIHKHKLMSYGYIVKVSDDVPLELINTFDIPTVPVIFRGSISQQEVGKHFLASIVDVARKIDELLKTNLKLNMTYEDTLRYNATKNCEFCKSSFDTVMKVRDHFHLTGKFRQSLCFKCNLDFKKPNFVPVYFHNLSNYDSHFIITELGYDTHAIQVIPNSEEKYISFSKYVSKTFTIRFVDTCRFLPSSLENLANNLITPNFVKFRETAKHFNAEHMTLVTRKGVYPYEYTDGWEKLGETSLPDKNGFYSMLNELGVKDAEYAHANKVWEHFDCETLGEYSDLYLKIDVLLLADVFENFRDLCMKTYSLDPAFYFTAPGYSFDAMLRYTSIKLELLTDYEMLLMFEKGNHLFIILLFKYICNYFF